MKKLIVMAVAMLLSASAFAQREVGSITIQPKVGLNIANITGSKGDSRIGLAVGVEGEYQVTDMFGISAGLLYSAQGNAYSESGVDYTTKLDYINIPILANCYVAKGFAVKLGIQPGFNVTSKFKAKGGGNSVESEFDAKTVDFSIPVGVSYEFSNIQVDARYNWGLTKIVDGDNGKNSVFQITLGYKFEL